MKEYWVNVHTDGKYIICNSKNISDCWLEAPWALTQYRFHVREFDTREAKELYLKMKYGNPQYPRGLRQYRRYISKDENIWE